MKNQNVIIAGLLIIILILGGYYLFKNANAEIGDNNNQRSTQDLSQNDSNVSISSTNENESIETVQYTQNGFSPRTITIKSGTTITWINNSDQSVWVASDPHPTHTDLPDFDSKKSISSGSSYSFTFTIAGTFGYHNHIESSDKGTVNIEP